ncbi:protein IQ-DOMAIN 1-like [Iris pallida]|uniref:Protein IQ-DOMAIN 1-like n=1 Tax=Iris pallida TaxID=29817 RepID=A0AAX6F7T8_IRIPA|nr:protein IQ-DOMAIN 1-like [Iris pallida]
MGRKGKWFGAVKRAFNHESKDKKAKKSHKSKKRWFGKCTNFDESPSEVFDDAPSKSAIHQVPERSKSRNAENDHGKQHAYSVALASAVAAEAAAVAAQAAAEVVRLTKSARFSDRSKEEVAAIKIQTAFRGYMARRALRALRGLVRLKALTSSDSVKRQASATLSCMQTLARVQSQIRSRRIRMTEENQALQKQLQLKHERELEKQRMADEWDTSLQSKEQIEASLQNKQDAAIRRERAMAYAFSHQWKNSARANPMFMDPNNTQWGWSWMERWTAARPWESRSAAERDPNGDRASVRSATRSVTGAEIAKAYARRDSNLERPPSPSAQRRPASRHSLSSPPSKAPSSTRKVKSASPKAGWRPTEELDTGSFRSMKSQQVRQNSIAGSSARDDASLVSTPAAVPSYMASTESAKAKSRSRTLSADMSETASERGSVSSARKRLSFPVAAMPSPGRARRHSGPPKVDVARATSSGGSR